MKSKIWPFHLAYYILYLLLYVGFLFLVYLIYDAVTYTIGSELSVLFGIWVLPLTTPIYIILATRFSLLKWSLDPIAAFMTPLGYYCFKIISIIGHGFLTAFHIINTSLSRDDGRGWWLLVGLFVLGLFLSFSVVRKEGESISFRLLERFSR